MQSINKLKTSISSEIDQQEILQKNFILQLLSSKRLLDDHVEIMEEAVVELLKNENLKFDLLTFLKTSSILATSFVVFIHLRQNFRYLIPSVTGIVPIMYMQKLINVRKRELLEADLKEFLKSLDHYETGVRKNLSFLHEAHHMKVSSTLLKRYDKHNKIPLGLAESIKRAINVFYKFVKDLEESYVVMEKLNLLYEPFENIEDCQLMTVELQEVDNKTIKDFFNIFAYVQSQALLRFGLIVASDVHEGICIVKTKIAEVTQMLNAETSNIMRFLDIINNAQKLQLSFQRQIDEEIASTIPNELRHIRSSSMKFSAKMLALTIHCQNLEDLMADFSEIQPENPDTTYVDQLLAVMKNIDSELAICRDEHQRIVIMFQKYLNLEVDTGKIDQDRLKEIESLLEQQNIKRVAADDDVEPQSDDFFFVDGNEMASADDDDDGKYHQEAIEEVNSKLAKRYFKPVLVQLKERIEVISDEMKEREKKVLKSKGIEIQDEPALAKVSSDEDDNESGSDDERERQRKFKRNEEKFSGNREFLESKQPVNIFAGDFPLPSQNTLDEEVLE